MASSTGGTMRMRRRAVTQAFTKDHTRLRWFEDLAESFPPPRPSDRLRGGLTPLPAGGSAIVSAANGSAALAGQGLMYETQASSTVSSPPDLGSNGWQTRVEDNDKELAAPHAYQPPTVASLFKSGILRLLDSHSGAEKQHVVFRDPDEAKMVQVVLLNDRLVILVFGSSVTVCLRSGPLDLVQQRRFSIPLPKEVPGGLQARFCHLLKRDRLFLCGAFSYCFCEPVVDPMESQSWESLRCVQSGKTDTASSSVMRAERSDTCLAVASRGMCAVWSLEPVVARSAAISVAPGQPLVTALGVSSTYLVVGFSDGSVSVRSARTGHHLCTLLEAPTVPIATAKGERESPQFALTGVDLRGKVNCIRIRGKFCCVGFQTGFVRLFLLSCPAASDDASDDAAGVWRTGVCNASYCTPARDAVRKVAGVLLAEEKIGRQEHGILHVVMFAGKVFCLVENSQQPAKKKSQKAAGGLIRSLTRSGTKSVDSRISSRLYSWTPRLSKHAADFLSATQRVSQGDVVVTDTRAPKQPVESEFDNLALWDAEESMGAPAPPTLTRKHGSVRFGSQQRTICRGQFGPVLRILTPNVPALRGCLFSQHLQAGTGGKLQNKFVFWQDTGMGESVGQVKSTDVSLDDPRCLSVVNNLFWASNGLVLVVFDTFVHVLTCSRDGSASWLTMKNGSTPLVCRDRITCSMVRESKEAPQLFLFTLAGTCEVFSLDADSDFPRIAEIPCHIGPVTAGACEGDFLATGGEDTLLKVFFIGVGLEFGKKHMVFSGHHSPVTSVAMLRRDEDFTEFLFSVAAGENASSASDVGAEIRCWDRNTGVLLRTICVRDGLAPFLSQVFPGDEVLLMRDGQDAGLSFLSWGLWPGRSKLLQRFQGHVGKITELAVAPAAQGDESRLCSPLFSIAEDASVRLWNVQEPGSVVAPLLSHGTGLLGQTCLAVANPETDQHGRHFCIWVGCDSGNLVEVEFFVPHTQWVRPESTTALRREPPTLPSQRVQPVDLSRFSKQIRNDDLPPIPEAYRMHSGVPTKPLPIPPIPEGDKHTTEDSLSDSEADSQDESPLEPEYFADQACLPWDDDADLRALVMMLEAEKLIALLGAAEMSSKQRAPQPPMKPAHLRTSAEAETSCANSLTESAGILASENSATHQSLGQEPEEFYFEADTIQTTVASLQSGESSRDSAAQLGNKKQPPALPPKKPRDQDAPATMTSVSQSAVGSHPGPVAAQASAPLLPGPVAPKPGPPPAPTASIGLIRVPPGQHKTASSPQLGRRHPVAPSKPLPKTPIP